MIYFATEFVVEPLAPEKLFSVGPLDVTNSLLVGWLGAIFLVIVFWLAARASQTKPLSKLAFAVESLISAVFNLLDETFNNQAKTFRHFPLLICLLLLILIGNISGLLPGVDTISLITHEGSVPLFRSWTTDLNTTLALAVLSLATVHYYAVKEIGFRGYAKHFFPGRLINPMTWFMGINELFGEILRLVTLSLRLFGVIYGGEALLFAISALAGNFGWAAAFPVILLELFVSLVQAYLFMMLTASYIVMSTTHGADESEHEAQPAVAKV